MLATQIVERGEQLGGAHFLAVQRGPVTFFEIDGDVFGRIRRILGMVGARIDVIRRFFPRVFQHLAFGRGVEEVGIGRKRAFAALVLGHLDLVLFRPGDQRGAAGEVPFAPRGDHLDVGCERIGAEFEADLIVALAGGAVSDRIGPGLARDFDQPFGDQRPRDAGAEQVIAFVAGIGAHHREDEIAHEFLAQILDEDVLVRNAHRPCLFARGLDLFALAEIGSEGDDFESAFDLEPFGDHGRVETAGIGKDDFLDIGHGRHLWDCARIAGREERGSRESRGC